MSKTLPTIAVSPTGEEVTAHLKAALSNYPDICKRLRCDPSDEGRPLEAILISDFSIPAAEKQNCLILGGRHGNEESGRAQALAIIDYLLSAAAKTTRAKQHIIIMPNLNPDGAARDLYKRSDGINVCNDRDSKNPCPETRAYLSVIDKYPPDAVIDLHARGFAGHSYDMVLHPATRDYTQDHIIMQELVQDMVQAGEDAGTLHIAHPLSWDGWVSDSPVEHCYRTFKSLCILTESAEHNEHSLSIQHRAKVGLARAKTLLARGNNRHPHSPVSGYPYSCITGLSALALIPYGKNPAQRRKSRIAVWQQRTQIAKLSHSNLPAKKHDIQISLQYTGSPLPHGAGIQIRVSGKQRVVAVHLNGEKHTDHYLWYDKNTTFIVCNLKRIVAQDYNIDIKLADKK